MREANIMNRFMPHGYCMQWDFWLLTQHVTSDLLIAAAYFSIPVALVTFVRKRKDVTFSFIFWLFSLFIFSCGITHLLEIYLLWHPLYWVAGWAKTLTAVASVATAIVLWRVIPQALQIPSHHELESANTELQEQLRMREEAERGSRQKDDFLATLSHELRTPLNAILGWVQLLEEGHIPKNKQAEALEVIARNARSQAQLINDLLDLSGIAAGKMRMENQAVNLNDVVKGALATVMPTAAQQGVRLEGRIPAADHVIQGDNRRLQQVVWNLLSNALKFTPSEGRVEVAVTGNASEAVLTVTDTGIGIESKFLPQVFERFKQADGGTTRTRGGMGIGLALAREIVLLHGGQIHAASAGLGFGSTFTVRLPKSSFTSEDPEASKAKFSAQCLAGHFILVAEDDADSRNLFLEICRQAGAEVVAAATAEEALDAANARRPSALVSDIAMPGHDGIWLIRRIRERHGNIPAIAVSAFAHKEDRAAARDAGFHLHLSKPVEPSELLRSLNRLLTVGEGPGDAQ